MAKKRRKVESFGDDYMLVQTSQDVAAVLESIDRYDLTSEYDYLLIKQNDTDLEEVWGIEGVPYVGKTAWRVL
jgi:hypothetical protein